MKQNILLSAAAIGLIIALMASGCKTVTNPPDNGNNTTITPTWTAGNFGTNQTILGVSFPSPQVGYACGFHGTLLKTVDSGKTWTALNANAANGTNLYRISFRDVNTGVAAGNNATIIRTTDGGATWTDINTSSMPGDDNVRDISYVGSKIIVVGGLGQGEGFVYVSSDNGVTWSDAKETTGTIYSIAVQSSNAFTVVGISGQIMGTSDFGRTWSDESVNAPGDDFMATNFFDANHGITTSFYGTIYSSNDAGLIWSPQSSGLSMSNAITDGLLRTVKMVSSTEAWAAGEEGTILHTTNGGSVWTQTSISGTSGIAWNQIAQRDAHTLAFVGDNGTLYWYSF